MRWNNRSRNSPAHKQVAWWAIRPEELRWWRKDEMQYLAIVCETIRDNDPRDRPIYMYNPNHRDAKSLIPIAEHVDVLAKGCYVNHVGRKRDRAWVRWSVEQEIEALKAAGRPDAIPLVMPELCRDPEPNEDTRNPGLGASRRLPGTGQRCQRRTDLVAVQTHAGQTHVATLVRRLQRVCSGIER